jgi:hypothetical protein
MERKEAYEQIKKLGLQEECKKKFGKNFTQCKTDELIHLIDSYKIQTGKKVTKKETSVKKEDTIDLVTSFKKLLETLRSRHILLDSEVKRILG